MSENREARFRRTVADGALSWEMAVPLLTHPLMMGGFVKVFGLTAILLGSFLSFLMLMTGGADAISAIWMLVGTLSGGLFIVGLIVSVIIFGNRIDIRFSLDDDGVECELIDRRARAASAAAIFFGTLLGRPGAVGTGLIGATDTLRRATWEEIESARFHGLCHAISLRNPSRTVMILFCTPGDYEAVVARVQAKIARQPAPASARSAPLTRLLLHSVLIVAASIPLFTLPYPLKADPFAVTFTLAFALASLWMIPALSYPALGGLAWIWLQTAHQLLEPQNSYIMGESFKAIRWVSGDDWAHLGIAAAGSVYLIWLSVGLLRGKISSGLASRDQ